MSDTPSHAPYDMPADIPPVPPSRLCGYAREVLELLAGHAAAAEIVIGGGVALSHYVEYRDTFDLDAWWATAPTSSARELMGRAMHTVAERHGLTLTRRTWGETESYELADGPRKVFSLQIAARDRFLEPTLEAAWPPVRLETLRDNVASKMTALVERGAPRDLRDVYHLCHRGILSAAECWQLYCQKNPGHDVQTAADKVLHCVERLEMQRPLDTIESQDERLQAAAVRAWYRDIFCKSVSA
ncbi:MAG: hypothetical protein EBZ74_02280 [Planctomycetia bacterium]|nr:hypothetical protein [Planctomycetia bacterium]